MNRRGFIALATAATVAPQELIRPVAAPAVDLEAIAAARFAALIQSMLQTRETISAAVYQAMIFGRAYTFIDHSGVMKLVEEKNVQETLASEVRSCSPAILTRTEAETEASGPPIELGGAGCLLNTASADESS